MTNNLIKININNIEILTRNNITIIQACLNSHLNIDLPRFCFHEKLSIAGNCRMCLVEVLKSPKPVVACAMQVLDGMVIKTNTNLVKKAREGVLEFLLANHPLDCPVCDQAGECDLQDQSMIFGGDMGRFYDYKRSVENKNISPLIKTVMTRCIHCTRCVRFLKEIGGVSTLGVTGRGNKMEIGTYLEKIVTSELSGNIVDICPVGALTSAPSAFKSRSWELISKESLDILDSLSADTKIDMIGTSIIRVLPRLNEVINESWLADNSRYYDYNSILSSSLRLINPYQKNKNIFQKRNWNNILNTLWKFIYINKYILSKCIYFVYSIGELCDAQSLIMLKEFNSFFHNSKKNKNSLINNDFRQNYLLKYKKSNFLTTDMVMLVGLNLRIDSPLYNIRLRKLYLKKKILIIYFGSTANLTYHFQHLGLSFESLLKFVEGKHLFCNLFLRSYKPFALINSNLFENNKSIYNLFVAIKKKFKSNLEYGVVNKYIGNITAYEVNVNNYTDIDIINKNNNYLKNNILFNYLLNINKKNNIKNFNIYQGILNYSLLSNLNINICLPGLNYLEKSSNYISIEGINRKTHSLLNFNNNTRNDWQIIFIILLKFNSMKNKLKLFNLNKYYKSNIINLFSKKDQLIYDNTIIVLLKLLFLNNFNNNTRNDLQNIFNLNFIYYNFIIFYFYDLNFNFKKLSNISPLFTNKLYHSIIGFNILYKKPKIKLHNINLISFNYNKNNLIGFSKYLNSKYIKTKLSDTNYI